MKHAACLLILFSVASPAAAHIGHLGEVSGHAHWIAGAAIGLAGAIALWVRTRGRKDSACEEAESTEGDPEADSDEAVKA